MQTAICHRICVSQCDPLTHLINVYSSVPSIVTVQCSVWCQVIYRVLGKFHIHTLSFVINGSHQQKCPDSGFSNIGLFLKRNSGKLLYKQIVTHRKASHHFNASCSNLYNCEGHNSAAVLLLPRTRIEDYLRTPRLGLLLLLSLRSGSVLGVVC